MTPVDAAFRTEIVGIPTPDPRLAKLDAKIEGLKEARRLLADCRIILRFNWQAERPWAREALGAICSARDRMGRDLKNAKDERARLKAGDRIYLP